MRKESKQNQRIKPYKTLKKKKNQWNTKTRGKKVEKATRQTKNEQNSNSLSLAVIILIANKLKLPIKRASR